MTQNDDQQEAGPSVDHDALERFRNDEWRDDRGHRIRADSDGTRRDSDSPRERQTGRHRRSKITLPRTDDAMFGDSAARGAAFVLLISARELARAVA